MTEGQLADLHPDQLREPGNPDPLETEGPVVVRIFRCAEQCTPSASCLSLSRATAKLTSGCTSSPTNTPVFHRPSARRDRDLGPDLPDLTPPSLGGSAFCRLSDRG